MIQKQGNTEAVPVGRPSVVIALVPVYIIPQSFNFSQYINIFFDIAITL